MAGLVAAAGAAIGFAVFQVVQRRALRGIDVYRGTAGVLLVAAVVLGAVAAATTGVAPLLAAPGLAVLACGAAGLLHFGVGWTLLGASQVRLGAARTGIVVGTVPLFGALVAALALDESLGLAAVLGLAATVAGVGVVVGRPRDRVRTRLGTGSGATVNEDTTVPVARRDIRVGVLAGLGTAVCWSVSPVLIRYGLRDLGSPLVGAAIGMAACATAYAIVVAANWRSRWSHVQPGSGRLLLVSGTAVSLAILLQWTAYDLIPVAVVLGVLQLTPPLVVALAARFAGDDPEPAARRRAWLGAALTLAGSVTLVVAG